MPTKYTRQQRIDAFWRKVDIGEECWLWLGSRNENGYGIFIDDGRHKIKAHRFAYMLLVSPISLGFDLDHLCRNRHCVNPEHLEAVTRQENLRRGLNGILKTHCPQGHPYDAENTAYYSGNRYCRTCNRGKSRRLMPAYRQRIKQQQPGS